ncbi:PH domain-containing protein [Streptomyces sp. NPDC001480]|uniref:PH domain-containing protein n=1 Tax=Streptomyces sp. NPDC001480 TaxID=3364577 RepID=UPI00368E649B
MTDVREVTCLPPRQRTLWFLVVLGAAGTVLAGVCLAYAGGLVGVWVVGLLPALMGVMALHWVTARVSADAYGVRIRTLWGTRSVPWGDVAGLWVCLKYGRNPRVPVSRRVGLAMRDGRKRLLPLPWSGPSDPEFDATLEALRTLHRRHGTPESGHVPVVSYRTAGRGWAGSLSLCALLLVCAGVAAWFVPNAASTERAWRSARPCTSATPASARADCLTTLPAVIARTDANRPKKSSWLYFAGGSPMARVEVSREAAEGFRRGDRVELTVWRGEVREVSGPHYVWHEHVTGAGDVAAVAAALALAAGYPAAQVLLRLRGRRLPDDEVLPSVLPFAGVLVGTALWLLPLCYLHPTTLLTSPVALAWAASGSLATLALLTWAWRTTRVRTPQQTAAREESGAREAHEVFLAARFLEHTDYNPHGFGTHIALGDGAPAVAPGPGRFAAKRIPVERLALRSVRRARGSDGDTVPRSWHIAELDDAGRTVRLAAAPADLDRVLSELNLVRATANT